jgi:hypothetical protein
MRRRGRTGPPEARHAACLAQTLMDTAKNDHDLWMEKILSAVRSLRQQLESSKAGAGAPDAASRITPGPGREGQR